MTVCRSLLKIIMFPVLLILLLLKGLINLVINLTSVVVGLFTLFISGALIYCLISHQWRDLVIFIVIGVSVIGLLFFAVLLVEFIDDLRARIKAI